MCYLLCVSPVTYYTPHIEHYSLITSEYVVGWVLHSHNHGTGNPSASFTGVPLTLIPCITKRLDTQTQKHSSHSLYIYAYIAALITKIYNQICNCNQLYSSSSTSLHIHRLMYVYM